MHKFFSFWSKNDFSNDIRNIISLCGHTKIWFSSDEVDGRALFNLQHFQTKMLKWCKSKSNFHYNRFAGPSNESPVREDSIVLLTGGFGNGRLSSSEVFPSTNNCSLPSLPEPREDHVVFATAEEDPRVAVCGGSNQNGDKLASCLVLDRKAQAWDETRVDSLPQPRYSHAAVTLKNIGTYLVGGFLFSDNRRTTDFLPEGSRQWMSGPSIPVDMNQPCAVVIGKRSFLTIFQFNIREYQVDVNNPTSSNGWQRATKWPKLLTNRRKGPGCARIGQRVIIAGGYSSEVERSTEVLNIETRTIEYAHDLNTPRQFFHIVSITTEGVERTFALGGYDFSTYLDSVEKLDPETLIWRESPLNLVERRDQFGAVELPKSLAC